MNLVFRSTEDFEQDLQGFDEAARRQITERVNQVAQDFIHDQSAFAVYANQPRCIELNHDYDSSLYVVKTEPDVRILMTIDDDTIFEQVIVTLMRVVQKSQALQVYTSLIKSLFKSLNGREVAPLVSKVFDAEKGVPVG